MSRLIDLSPEDFAAELRGQGGRACLVTRPESDGAVASAPWLQELADFLNQDERDYQGHEGVFLAVGPETGVLFGAFVHSTVRGQGQGGLRNWPYERLDGFLRDGLRLSLGMSRKSALAQLWWGGGKGVIARPPGDGWRDPAWRRALYREYGAFTTSLRGVYVTAEDVGTSPADMAAVFETTRHATCVPGEVGGSGNPSGATARGVVCAMEAALDVTGKGTLNGKTIAIQGAGNVAGFMIDDLLEKGVGRVIATDIDAARCEELRQVHAGRAVEIRTVVRGDDSILAERCDVLAPSALGGVLNPDTIPTINAPIVCGAANNQLLDDQRDDAALAERGIVYVPDFVANRMGIVNCADESFGFVPHDPAFERHFDRDWDSSIFATTKKVLETARDGGVTTSDAANILADEGCMAPHPIWGHRGWQIIEGLLADGWVDGAG